MMRKILIIGATGNVGSAVRETLLAKTDDFLTLFARHASELKINKKREHAVSGNVNDLAELEAAMKNQDAVFVALSGNLGELAQKVVTAMQATKVKRLVFITSMGIYNEIPASVGSAGNLENNPMLINYRKAADIIENSDLDYTLIRPGWFDHGSEDYEITHKGEPFGGHDVAINSIADLACKLLQSDTLDAHDSLGINRK